MPILRWEKPPPARRSSSDRPHPKKWLKEAEELKNNPGVWGVLHESTDRNSATMATHIREGILAAFKPAGDFAACSRKVEDTTTIYVRYLGEGLCE